MMARSKEDAYAAASLESYRWGKVVPKRKYFKFGAIGVGTFIVKGLNQEGPPQLEVQIQEKQAAVE